MITVNKIKTIVPISKSIDEGLIVPQISLAQIKYIRKVLGNLLYEDINTKYNSQTLNSIETQLVENIQIPLAFYVVDNTLPMLSYQMTEKGVQQQNGVNSQPADVQSNTTSLMFIRNELRSNGEFYLNEVRDFLKENKDSFPLYQTEGNDPKTTQNFTTGIAFYPRSNYNQNRGYFQ